MVLCEHEQGGLAGSMFPRVGMRFTDWLKCFFFFLLGFITLLQLINVLDLLNFFVCKLFACQSITSVAHGRFVFFFFSSFCRVKLRVT